MCLCWHFLVLALTIHRTVWSLSTSFHPSRYGTGTCEQSLLSKANLGQISHTVASGPLQQNSLDCFWKYFLATSQTEWIRISSVAGLVLCIPPISLQVVCGHTIVRWPVLDWVFVSCSVSYVLAIACNVMVLRGGIGEVIRLRWGY